MVMAPMAGISPWLEIMEVTLPMDAELAAGLATSDQPTMIRPEDSDGNEEGTSGDYTASVQMLGYVSIQSAALASFKTASTSSSSNFFYQTLQVSHG
jgi:hypothetical protein